ncbi:unnamed protein product [Brassicogethes aeneus]|uniref:FAD dependent oxidoreductase domain-containing protein n=1 Tax=Brassicogethes aeneus TaxID=1431903 RepID=A0A9P0B1B8_BRAAE|nr:unnamed protein product [Brassicogethes aeneus]
MLKVAVIGCGAVGLTTALCLQEKLGNGATIQIFTTKVSPNTTSDIAAGLWEPLVHTSESSEDKIIKWGLCTYKFIINLWKEGYAKNAGIVLQPVIKVTEDPNFIPPQWLKYTLGFSVLSKDYLKKLSKDTNHNFAAGIQFVSFTWEASTFLPYLQKQFLQKGGQIINKTIEDLDKLNDFDVIVNCTGIGAAKLLQDTHVFPIRGQIARVAAPWLFSSICVDNNYIIPNTNCVILGGTKQREYNTQVYAIDTQHILKGCMNIVPSLETADIIKEQVGLRPGRTELRLELELRNIKGKMVRVLHNYGHGGSGITLSIGCAMDAVDLILKSILSNSKL